MLNSLYFNSLITDCIDRKVAVSEYNRYCFIAILLSNLYFYLLKSFWIDASVVQSVKDNIKRTR